MKAEPTSLCETTSEHRI